MRPTLTDQLLLLFADVADRQRQLTHWSLIASIPGDPRLRKYRQRVARYLRNRRTRRLIVQQIHNLKRRGYLQERVLGNSRGYTLSPLAAGKIFPLRARISLRASRLPPGQWLMVYFDVPEEHRQVRDRLRIGLRSLGFEPLQRSVWATRYRVGLELKKLLALLGANAYAKPLLVQEYTSPK